MAVSPSPPGTRSETSVPDLKPLVEFLKKRKAEHERAQKVIFDLTIAKETAEAELRDAKAALVKEGEERAQLVIKLGSLMDEMVVLKDKERARSKIIDAQTARAENAEKRAESFEKILSRLADELQDEFLTPKPEEEAAEAELEEIQEGAVEALAPGPKAEQIMDETAKAVADLPDDDEDEIEVKDELDEPEPKKGRFARIFRKKAVKKLVQFPAVKKLVQLPVVKPVPRKKDSSPLPGPQQDEIGKKLDELFGDIPDGTEENGQTD